MALLRVESWDHFATADRGYKGWSFAHVGASPGDAGCSIGAFGRNSTNGLRGRNEAVGGQSTRAALGVSNASGATAIMGFGFRINTAVPAGDFPVCTLMRGSTELISVTCSATGTLSVRRGGRTGTVLSTSASTLSHTTYYFVELKVVLHDSTGTYDLLVNGVSFTSGSGVDTLISGAATWDGILLGGTNVTVTYSVDFDDLYIADGTTASNNDFLGDHRIVCVVASAGNGTHTDYAPSTGSDRGAMVDDNPPDVADYVQGGTAGDRVTFNFAALGVTGTVKAVQTVNLAKAEAAGIRTQVPAFRIGAADYDGNGSVLGSDWSYQVEVHITNPDTVAAWTVSEIDGAEFGAAVTA
jgi:hypothetical protein